MRKLTMAALISISTLSFGATAAFANSTEIERCNGGPPLGAEERSAAAEPRPQNVPGVTLGCLEGTDQSNYSDRNARGYDRNARVYDRDARGYDRNARGYDRDSRDYNASRSNLTPVVPGTTN